MHRGVFKGGLRGAPPPSERFREGPRPSLKKLKVCVGSRENFHKRHHLAVLFDKFSFNHSQNLNIFIIYLNVVFQGQSQKGTSFVALSVVS